MYKLCNTSRCRGNHVAFSGRTPVYTRIMNAPFFQERPGCRHSCKAGQLPGSIQGIIDEMKADPKLRPAFESPRVQQALSEIKTNPAQALAKYANDPQVMSILQRLAALGLKDTSELSALVDQMGITAADVAASVFSDGDLAAKLTQPRIRQAIAEIRQDPEGAMLKYENDAEVMGILDALQARLEASGKVIDV